MRTKHILAIIMIAAFVLRFAAFLYLSSHNPLELYEFEEISKNLASGNGFKCTYLNATYYSCTTPLYPFICAAIYRLFGVNHNIVIFLQIIISVFTCMVLFDLGRRIATPTVGLVSALLYAIHPGLIVYSAFKLHALVFDVFFLTLTLWSFMYLKEALNLRRGFLAGIISGLCILTRSTIVVFISFGILWLFWHFRNRLKRVFITVLCILTGILVVISPWIIRNFLVHKEFILTTSADAEVFWRGNNINATGTSYASSGESVLMEDKVFYNKVISISELEQRKFFRKEALKFIKENPEKFVKLFLKKFYYFWWFPPSSGILYPSGYLAPYMYMYGVLVFLSVVGFYNVLARRIKIDIKNFILLVLFLLSISLSQSLFYVEGRHRWGIEPDFLIISAIGIVGTFQNIINLIKAVQK